MARREASSDRQEEGNQDVKAKPKRTSDSHTVRVRTPTLTRLKALVDEILHRGWSAVGAEREDQILPGSVIDQGLLMLEAKMKGSRR